MVRRSGLGKGLDALLPSTPSDEDSAPLPPAAPPTSTPPAIAPAPSRPPEPPRAADVPSAPQAGASGAPGPAEDDRSEASGSRDAGSGGTGSAHGDLRDIPVHRIRPNRHQPRAVFDDEALESLTASIAELGVLQPVLVREVPGSEDFELIAGERRWRASRRAGLDVIPAVVRTIDDTRSLQEALVENVQREDLNPIEEAQAYQQLIDEFAFTQDAVGQAVGRSRSAVANILRLLHLPTEVQEMVSDGRLSAGHARALLGIDDHAALVAVALRVERDGLSVRETEEAVRKATEPAPAPAAPRPSPMLRPAAVLEVEERLSDLFETRVKVEVGAKSGKVVVQFADLEDLDRIFTVMVASRGDVEG